MTVVTANLHDVTGVPDNSSFVFTVPDLREGDDGTSIVTTTRKRVKPSDAGVLSVDLEPGYCGVTYWTKSYTILVPESGPVDLWGLIAAGVAFPDGTPAAVIGAAVSAYLVSNPPAGSTDFYANLAGFPATGDAGTEYVAIDTGKLYRWNAGTTAYVELSAVGPAVDVQTHAATGKTTPVDADEIPLADSAASFGLKKLTFANLKAWIKGLFVSKDSLAYNVLDHGVLADGSTDNTTAYAALVTTVVAAGGGTILFPPATSQYMGSLVINANVPIKAVGYGAILQGPSAGTTVTINTGQTGGSGQTVIAEGFIVKGNADQTTDGVLVKDTSRARLVNLQIVRTNNGVKIQNHDASQNSEATTIRSTLINDCVTGVRFDIVSGGPSFDETVISDVGINNCTTGIYLPTGSNHVRSVFDATVWVGRTSSTNGVAMYTNADMTRVWGRLGGELYFGATSATGVMVGPNASNFALCDLQLHIQGSVSPVVDVTTSGGSGQVALWREGLTYVGQSNSTPGTNMVGPNARSMTDTFPRSGFSLGSANNAPMPPGRDGLFFGPGNAQADTTLFRAGAHILEQGYSDVFLTGQAATGSRPSASTVGQGAQFFDTSLNKPIWSDGTNWHDVTTFADSVIAIGNTGTAKTISLTNGTVQTATLTGNCTFTMPTTVAGQSFQLLLKTGAGSFTAAFTGVKWPAGTAPTITVTAARLDIITFTSDGTDWYGSFVQNYTP